MEILDRRFQSTRIIVGLRLSRKEKMTAPYRETLLIFSSKAP